MQHTHTRTLQLIIIFYVAIMSIILCSNLHRFNGDSSTGDGGEAGGNSSGSSRSGRRQPHHHSQQQQHRDPRRSRWEKTEVVGDSRGACV